MAIKGLNPEWMEQYIFKNPVAKTGHISRKFEDIAYGNEPLQKMDIYLPEEGEGPFPLIVMIHGGGMCVCDKHDFHMYPLFYALEEGFAVAAINYRLSPAVKYPVQVWDCKQALLYIAEHSAEYSLDCGNIFLWGTSAGGNLVLMCGMKKGMELPEELRAADDIPVRGVAALCAEATMTETGGLGSGIGTFGEQLTTSISMLGLNRKVLGTNRPSDEQFRAASVFTYLPYGVAPLYIQHGDKDPAVPYAQSLKLYAEAGKVLADGDLVMHTLPGAAHAGAGIDYFLKENVEPILDFFRAHMQK